VRLFAILEIDDIQNDSFGRFSYRQVVYRGTEKSFSALYYRDLHLKKKEIIIAPNIIVYELTTSFDTKKIFQKKKIFLD